MQHFDAASRASHAMDGVVIVEVASRGDVGQQKVVFAHGDQHCDVGFWEAHTPSNGWDQFHANHCVVARVALANVVQERGSDQVGATGLSGGHVVGTAQRMA